jgi:sorbitol-6-phosphate 2-dehydrogenase
MSGEVFTPMLDSMTADYAAKRNMKPEEVKPYFKSKIPRRRLCEINDVAKAALFLALEENLKKRN